MPHPPPPHRPPNPGKTKKPNWYNESRRGREWLEEDEVTRIRKAAAKLGRHGHRDATMILIAFRHGLRVSELVSVRWDQINLDEQTIYIRRCKGSKPGMHTMERDEVGALRKLGPNRKGLVFRSERSEGPISERSFYGILVRAAEAAGIGMLVHPHMLRHACGYALGNADRPTRLIQEWLGHSNIQNTVRYTELNPDRFRQVGMWSKKRA
jgi:type 1 fimbriae regulatory protein FimE